MICHMRWDESNEYCQVEDGRQGIPSYTILWFTYLIDTWSCDSDSQTSTLQGCDQFWRRVATKNQSTSGSILFHSSSQGRLCLFGHAIHLRQDDDFHFRRRVGICAVVVVVVSSFSDHVGDTSNILGRGHFFQDILNNKSIIVAGIARTQFHMMGGRNHVNVNWLITRSRERSLVKFQSLRGRSKESREQGVDARAFATSWRTIDKQMGETGGVGSEGGEAFGYFIVIRQVLESGGAMFVHPQHDGMDIG